MVRTQDAPIPVSLSPRVQAPAAGLPDVYVVGAAKSGTTALYRYFELHPQVFVPSSIKETNYMAFHAGLPPLAGPGDRRCVGRSVTSLAEYRQLYARRTGELVAADVSPSYLYYAHAPRKILELAPRAKIVMVLRNPVDCVLSMYSMMRRDGREPCRSLLAAFERSAERRAGGWEWAWDYQGCFKLARPVAQYMHLFPPGQLFVRRYEALQYDPQTFHNELAAFLGIAPVDVASFNRRANVAPRRVDMLRRGRAGRALCRAGRLANLVLPSGISAPVRRRMEQPAFRRTAAERRVLVDYFRCDVVQLSRLLDWDLRAWLAV